MLHRMFGACALMLAFVASPVWAQERLRATVVKVDGSTYIVKDRDGVEQKLARRNLVDGYPVCLEHSGDHADIADVWNVAKSARRLG